MRTYLTTFPLLLIVGCGQAPSTMAGGKPVSYWIEVLHGPDAALRKKAVAKLGNVGPTDPAVLPALLQALKDGEPAVRCETILALARFGSAAKEALPMLAELRLNDPDEEVRACAEKALGKLQPK
jgi:HEAT repeat protein